MEANSTSRDLTADLLVASTYLMLASFGFVVYVAFFVAVVTSKQLRKNAFFISSLSFGVMDVCALLSILVTAVPSTFAGGVYSQPLNIALGVLWIEIPWFQALPMLLVQALNRLVNIAYPDKVEALFGGRRIWGCVGACWAFGLALGLPTSLECCRCFYFYEDYSFGYNTVEFGSYVYSWISAGLSIFVVVVCECLNVVTFHALVKQHRSIGVAAQNANTQREALRRKRERKVFFQFFFILNFLLLLNLVFCTMGYIWVSKFAGVFSMIIYILNASMNGFVFVFFNETVQSSLSNIVKGVNNGETTVARGKATLVQVHPVLYTVAGHQVQA